MRRRISRNSGTADGLYRCIARLALVVAIAIPPIAQAQEQPPAAPDDWHVGLCAPEPLLVASAVGAQLEAGSSRLALREDKGDGGAGSNAKSPVLPVKLQAKPQDFNRSIYYRNKVEFGLDAGYLPDNIPFLFDRMVGIHDRLAPRAYTLAPFIFSLRWHFTDVGGRWIFRGNWDFSLSGAYTMIPRSITTAGDRVPSGAETRYFAHMWGLRRNFVQPRWRVAPFWEGRIGIGNINAKEPHGAEWAQGQDLTFTVMMGTGMRYNFNSKYSLSAGVNYMHISNLYLSEPRYPNYGINVYGPAFGFNMRLGKPKKELK